MHRKKKQTTIKMNINQASNTFLLIFFHKNLSCVAPFLDLAPAWILRPSMATPTSSTPKPSRNSRRPTQTRTTLASSRGQSISSLSAVYQQSISSLSAVISHGRPSPSLFSYVFMPSSRSTAEMLQGSMVSASPPAAGSVVTSHVTCGDVLCSKIKTQLWQTVSFSRTKL